MTAVAGSGIRIMSDSLMPFQPAIDEPSNILPSVKNPSFTSRVGTVTCCSLPIVSVKRRSANLASFSLINLRTSAGVICVLANNMSLWFPAAAPGSLAVQFVCQAAMHIRIKSLRATRVHRCTRLMHSGPLSRSILVQSGVVRLAPAGSSRPALVSRSGACAPAAPAHGASRTLEGAVAILAAVLTISSTRWPKPHPRRPEPSRN